MLYKKVFLLLTLIRMATVQAAPPTPEFVILITSYNNEKYAEANLASVCHQKSTKPYTIIYINDCSKDKTREITEHYKAHYHLDSKLTLIHNEERVGALQNIYNVIHTMIPDDKIVVSVDGDDRLKDNNVLLRLERAYRDPDIWITYGNAITVPGKKLFSKKVPLKVLKNGRLRQHPFVSQHLRTFKAGLFKKIKKEDLLYDGTFFPVTWDMAFMFPMLEMAAPANEYSKNHSLFISDVLYLYRMDNPINDFRVNYDLQKSLDRFIRSKPPYRPIDKLQDDRI